jgi:hypothetical protein
LRVLLDENMPESVRRALRQSGHVADSIVSLRLQGLDNGRLYREVAQSYDLFFTKDYGFVQTIRSIDSPGAVKVIRVVLPQRPHGGFTDAFLVAFRTTDWTLYPSGSDWPIR